MLRRSDDPQHEPLPLPSLFKSLYFSLLKAFPKYIGLRKYSSREGTLLENVSCSTETRTANVKKRETCSPVGS